MRPVAEEADPSGEPARWRAASSRARSGPSPTRIRVASGKQLQRREREILALALEQGAGGDQQRPVDAERRLGRRAVGGPEPVEVDAGMMDPDLLRRHAERRHVGLERAR